MTDPVAIICGSGNLMPAALIWDEVATETPYGPAVAPFARGEMGGQPVVFLKRHGAEHEYAPHQINYRANVWALAAETPRAIVATHTVGAISGSVQTADLIVPDQLIDYTWGREHTFSPEGAPTHAEFSFPLDAGLRSQLLAAAARLEMSVVDGGVYGCTQGPRLESAAEIDRMDRDGCSIVGMTLMPEAGLVREVNLPYASVCLAVNPAAGRQTGDPIDMAQIRVVSDEGMRRVERLLVAFLEDLETS